VGAYGENNGLRVLEHGRFIIPRGLDHLGIVSAILQDRQGHSGSEPSTSS